MDLSYLHLLSNHIPVFLSITGAFILWIGLRSKNQATQSAALFLILLSGIGATIAYYTGEPAEHLVKRIPGISHDTIEEHEEAALYCLIFSIAGAVLSLLCFYFMKTGFKHLLLLLRSILIISLFNFTVSARTAYLGGKIRHTEIDNTGNQPVNNSTIEKED